MAQPTHASPNALHDVSAGRGDTVRVIGHLQNWIVTGVDGDQVRAWTCFGHGTGLTTRTRIFAPAEIELVRRGNRLGDALARVAAARRRPLLENG